MTQRVSGPGIVEILHGHRPVVKGKFLYCGDSKLFVRGVTYGTFGPGDDGSGYRSPEVTAEDFAMMVENGVNVVRTYTVPPRWFLDLAADYGLRVSVGIAWEQHVAFLDDRDTVRTIEARVRDGVKACSGHPALLCYTVGNEIPASIVRWYGKRRTERFIERLYRIAKSADPQALVTYANYPSTEYLELPFLDFACFNVFLEQPHELEAYVARLHNVVGDRPLLLTELGLDSRRHGTEEQARSVASQVRTTFEGGCAGAVVFSWTDEWHRGGQDIDDWDFGLTDRQRLPKPSLAATSSAFGDVPYAARGNLPRITVAVCTYNGSRWLRECLEGIRRLDYPNYETIVVDDGSTDPSAAIAEEYDVRVIRTENRGLASARNTALDEADGEIIAYIDDDATPDPHWLRYLAAAFEEPAFAAVGGPNIPPEDEGLIAQCVAHSPGGPQHVMLSDTEAEHIPGCNMAFRREALLAVGGFDPQFRVAGDDVDICWQVQEHGWKLGFSPSAVVWHRRRATIRGYLRQQAGYGRAEALLERKWPEKYNGGGHVSWGGRVYASGLSRMGRFRDLLRDVGQLPVPVHLRALAEDARLAPADARVVPAHRDPRHRVLLRALAQTGGDVGAALRCAGQRRVAGYRPGRARGACLRQRKPMLQRRCGPAGDPVTPARGRVPLVRPAAGPALGTHALRADALAQAGAQPVCSALAADRHGLERDMGVADRPAASARERVPPGEHRRHARPR